MSKTIQPGSRELRHVTFNRAAINEDARTVELAFSSEQPYERYWGVEILDHSPSSINLSRLLETRPLLRDHNPEKLIGSIESISIDQDRVGRAVVRFGPAEVDECEEAWQLVKAGILRCVSVGYSIDEAVLEKKAKDGAPDTYRITRWTPYEISMVSVPADTNCQIGRSEQRGDTTVVIIEAGDGDVGDLGGAVSDTPVDGVKAAATAAGTASRNIQIIQEVNKMSDIDIQAIERNAREAELKRTREIIAIGEAFAAQVPQDLVRAAINDGMSVEQFRAKAMDVLATAKPIGAPDLGMDKKEQRAYSIRNAILAAATGNWKNAGLEREAHEAIVKRAGDAANGGFYVPYDVQKRDMTSAGASGSNYLVATDNLAGSFIDLLRARSVLAQLGATMLPGLVGNVTIPKMTAASTAYWLANEATAITESQPTIGQLTLTPRTVGAYTELSRLMLLQSSPAADSLVMDDFAKVLALAIDAAGIKGTGTEQPTGITGTAGIGSVTGTSLAYDDVLEFQSDVAGNNALSANCAYLTTPAVAALLAFRQRFSGTDTPIWTGNLIDGSVAGYRAATTTQMTAAAMLFGDFSQVVIGEWGQLELAVSNSEGSNFKAGILGIRAFQTVDVGVRQAGAFSLATSIT